MFGVGSLFKPFHQWWSNSWWTQQLGQVLNGSSLWILVIKLWVRDCSKILGAPLVHELDWTPHPRRPRDMPGFPREQDAPPWPFKRHTCQVFQKAYARKSMGLIGWLSLEKTARHHGRIWAPRILGQGHLEALLWQSQKSGQDKQYLYLRLLSQNAYILQRGAQITALLNAWGGHSKFQGKALYYQQRMALQLRHCWDETLLRIAW